MTVTKEARQYLIRKGGYYYRPNAQGYTGNKQEAGLYTFAEAWAYSHPNGEDGPRDGIDFVHLSEVPDPIRTALATAEADKAALRAEVDALKAAGNAMRDRLLGFVGALALHTDCGGDVDAIKAWEAL